MQLQNSYLPAKQELLAQMSDIAELREGINGRTNAEVDRLDSRKYVSQLGKKDANGMTLEYWSVLSTTTTNVTS